MEFVMALPFVAILAGIIFTVARASLVKSNAILDARNQAWHNRYGNGGGSDLSLSGAGEAEKFGGLTRSDPFRGLQSGSGAKSARVEKLASPPKYFFFGTINANANHYVFSRPWDHEEIPFESRPPLVVDSRAWIYMIRGGSIGSLADYANLFAELMNVLQPSDSIAGAWSKVQSALTTITNKLNELDREIRLLEEQIQNLRDRLRVATDNAIIRELEQQLDGLQAKLEKMRKGREKLQKAQQLGPR